jgi:hypothetical protein
MNARFLPPADRKDARVAARPLDDAIPSREVAGTLACCCPARAMVQAVMPPTAARPHETELLLCGHHYRASRTALAAAGAGGASPARPERRGGGLDRRPPVRRGVTEVHALVVYESMYGNTHVIASNIAIGLRGTYEVTLVRWPRPPRILSTAPAPG